MNHEWITKPIVCEGRVISDQLKSTDLLSQRDEIAYRMRLVMKSIEINAANGRRLACGDCDQLEHFETMILRAKLDEAGLRDLLSEFETTFSGPLQGDEIEMDARALSSIKRGGAGWGT